MMKPEQLLFIDIETAPCENSFELLHPTLQKLWKKKSALQFSEEEPGFSFENRAGVYAEFAKIVCISLGYFVQDESERILKIKTIASRQEREILEEFLDICNHFFKTPQRMFCGHNIREFDIPFICRRMFIQQMQLPAVLQDLQNRKPWDNPMLDTMQFWKFGEYKNFVSIELLAHLLDIPTPKDDIDGSEVGRVFWKEDNLERIAVYCGKDVVTVAQVYLRLHQLAILSPEKIMHIV